MAISTCCRRKRLFVRTTLSRQRRPVQGNGRHGSFFSGDAPYPRRTHTRRELFRSGTNSRVDARMDFLRFAKLHKTQWLQDLSLAPALQSIVMIESIGCTKQANRRARTRVAIAGVLSAMRRRRRKNDPPRNVRESGRIRDGFAQRAVRNCNRRTVRNRSAEGPVRNRNCERRLKILLKGFLWKPDEAMR
jgi:hypothetical protein